MREGEVVVVFSRMLVKYYKRVLVEGGFHEDFARLKGHVRDRSSKLIILFDTFVIVAYREILFLAEATNV